MITITMAGKRQRLALIPILGITVFLVLYFYAASLYPGGTKLDPKTVGYNHLQNYWCDLLDPISRSGLSNPARTYALVGTILLPIFLTFFWCLIPNLFLNNHSKLVKYTGTLSMILGIFIYTSAHNHIINLAGFLFLTAFANTEFELLRANHLFLFKLGLLAFGFALTDYVIWQFGIWLELLPVVQKAAFLSCFLWVVFACLKIRRLGQPS